MKGILLVMLLFIIGALSCVTIYDIQYTTIPGRDNTYPSTYVGKTVNIEGIVTAINYRHGGFFVSEPAGGPWRSIYIRVNNTSVKPGDKVILRGIVDEYFGMTCIQDLKAINIIDSNHLIPLPTMVTTGQITTPDQAEAYESTLVKVQNCTYILNRGFNKKQSISDGSGACSFGYGFIYDKIDEYKTNEQFSSLIGIVCYTFGEYSINPRYKTDVSVLVPVFNQNRSWGRIKSIYK